MASEPDAPSLARARELERATVAAGKFLALTRIRYIDAAGRERAWDAAERVGRSDAVVVVARLWPDGAWVLVRQYRPPAGAVVWEFPAGLLDAGEDPAAGALRELREETGYRGTVRAVWPAAYSSPGLTDESVHVAFVDVDGAAPDNARPRACPDDGEFLEVATVPFERGAAFLRARGEAGERFDGKVAMYLLGYAHTDASSPAWEPTP